MTHRPSAMATGIVDWAARAPERAAVVDVRGALTIGELDASAAALAARLLDGTSPGDGESWLPIVVDRSVASAVAVHGAIRAGRRFTRIESTLPRDVVTEMFTRLGNPSQAIITDPRFAELLPDGVERIEPFGHERAGTAAPQPVDHEAPGYVAFTSGTTGRPKGVIAPWSALDGNVETVRAFGQSFGRDQWAEGLVHPFGAGIVLRGVALSSIGCTMCIADPTAMSVDDLLDWFAANRIDAISLAATLSHAIIRVVDGRERLPSVSIVRCNSEAADWSLVAPLRRLVGPRVTIRSGLSATEVGRIARFDIGPEDPIGEGRIPVGRLEPGVEVRLVPLDGDLSTTQLVVARPRTLGYLSDPELTARRYFTDEDGTRWWRSHDVMRVDESGVYHHLGRADEMVKVKGAFVAPSRVEAALHSIPGIGAAAAVLHTAPNDSVRVVAHVEVVDESLTPEHVDALLRERLPRELVPAIVVRHDELPRTERTKLDRAALEKAPLVRWRSSRARRPRSEFEWWCVAEARRIIGVDDVWPDDDLFDAGLESIGALELGAALADAGFGEFDPPRLLEARTVAGIERMLGQPRDLDRSPVVVLNDGGSRPPLFALPGGGGNALEWRFLAEALGPEQPIAVVEMRGMHSPGSPGRTVEALATQVFDAIDGRLGSDGPCVIMAFSGGGPTAYETAQRMHARGRAVQLFLLDTAPSTRDRVRNPDRAPLPDAPPTIRTASVGQLPGAVLNSIRFRWRTRRLRRLIRDPGPPSFDPERYRAFRRIQSRANRAYEPAPAAFPAVLFLVDGSDAWHRCERVIPDLVVHEMDGAHETLLASPHVEAVAAIVAATTDDFLASNSAHRDRERSQPSGVRQR